MSLYGDMWRAQQAISANEQDIYDLMTTEVVDTETGEVLLPTEEDMKPMLDLLEGDSVLPIETLAEGILAAQAQVDHLKSREKAIARKRKSIESSMESFKTYVLNLMEVKNLTEIKGDTLKFKLKISKFVDVKCLTSELPKAYIRTKPAESEPNLVELKKALKAGEKISGVKISERSTVNIK